MACVVHSTDCVPLHESAYNTMPSPIIPAEKFEAFTVNAVSLAVKEYQTSSSKEVPEHEGGIGDGVADEVMT